MRFERLGQDVANRQARVERRQRILEHDLQVAPDGKSLGGRERGRVAAQHHDGAALGLHQVEDLHDRGGLAAARLADQPEGFTLPNVEADAVHGVYRADTPAHQPSLQQRVVFDEIANVQHGRPRLARDALVWG